MPKALAEVTERTVYKCNAEADRRSHWRVFRGIAAHNFAWSVKLTCQFIVLVLYYSVVQFS